jgi:hypothetical protein
VTTSLKIPGAVIPRNVFTQPRPRADLGRMKILHCSKAPDSMLANPLCCSLLASLAMAADAFP